MQKKDDAIYLEEWLSFHPYQRPVQSDYYYLKLSNEIYAILKDDFDITDSEYSAEETKNLACFLSCYFEDVNFLLWYFFSISGIDTDLISPEYMIDS